VDVKAEREALDERVVCAGRLGASGQDGSESPATHWNLSVSASVIFITCVGGSIAVSTGRRRALTEIS
jgi:hypothetical protein